MAITNYDRRKEGSRSEKNHGVILKTRTIKITYKTKEDAMIALDQLLSNSRRRSSEFRSAKASIKKVEIKPSFELINGNMCRVYKSKMK